MISKIFLDPVWYFYIFWFPEYLKNARHFDLAAIGKYAWIPFVVAGLGNLAGGALSGVLLRRGWSVTLARKSAITVFTLFMLAAIPAVLTPHVTASIAFVSIAMVGYTGALANTLAFPADVFPRHLVGSVWGLASMGAGLGGMIFALITGWVIDHYSYVPVFFGFGFLPLISALIMWTALGPLTPESYKPAR
jgi:ACS family hexuronate transporter-like MFS transporter